MAYVCACVLSPVMTHLTSDLTTNLSLVLVLPRFPFLLNFDCWQSSPRGFSVTRVQRELCFLFNFCLLMALWDISELYMVRCYSVCYGWHRHGEHLLHPGVSGSWEPPSLDFLACTVKLCASAPGPFMLWEFVKRNVLLSSSELS